MQMTLTAFMFGSSFSMIIGGLLADIIGKKRIQIYSLSIFLIATLVCTFTNNIYILIGGRFFQALGASCGTLVGRMWVKEFYHRDEQIKILSYLSLSMAICPLITPFLGAIIQQYFGWRSVFFVLALISFFIFYVICSQVKDDRITTNVINIKNILSNCGAVFAHKQFWAYSFAIGCVWSNYVSFIMESSFLLRGILGFESIGYSILITLPIIGYLAGIFSAKKYANKLGWDQLISLATYISLAGAIIMIISALFFPMHWISIICPMMLVMVGTGIIIPCSQGAVMQPFSHMAGIATGLFFFIQMLMGSLFGMILQTSSHQTALPLASNILVSSMLLVASFASLTKSYNKLPNQV